MAGAFRESTTTNRKTSKLQTGDVYTNINFDPIVEKVFPNCDPEPSTWSPCCIA
jgi:hypothetical protein